MFCVQTLRHSDAAPAGCQILYIAFVQCSVTVSYRFQDFISLRQSCMLCVETVMWHFHVTLGSIFARLCHWMVSRNVGGNSVGNFNVRTLNMRTLREQCFPCHETNCNDCLGTRGVLTKWWRCQFVTIKTSCLNPYYVWMTVRLCFIVIAVIAFLAWYLV